MYVHYALNDLILIETVFELTLQLNAHDGFLNDQCHLKIEFLHYLHEEDNLHLQEHPLALKLKKEDYDAYVIYD